MPDAAPLFGARTSVTTSIPPEQAPGWIGNALDVRPDWHYERAGSRQHYVAEAWLGGRFVGRAYGWYEDGSRLVLEKIEVEEAFRSQGHGAAMIEVLRQKARDAGCVDFLIKGVRADNARAIRLYESLGARASGTPGALIDFVVSPP